MTVCSRPTRAAFSRLAVWLYSNRSHHWRALDSESTTIVTGAGVRRPGLVEDAEGGRDRRDHHQAPMRNRSANLGGKPAARISAPTASKS
jgi:hypothetical protein